MVSLGLWSEVYVKHALTTVQQKLSRDLGWKCRFSEKFTFLHPFSSSYVGVLVSSG